MPYKLNVLTGEFDLVNDGGGSTNPHISYDAVGIYRERWHSTPGNVRYDVTMSDAGVLITSVIAESVPIWFTLYPQ